MFLVFVGTAAGIMLVALIGTGIAAGRPRGDFRCVDGMFVAPARRSQQFLWGGMSLNFLVIGSGYLTATIAPGLRVSGTLLFGCFGVFAAWTCIGQATTRCRVVIRHDGVEVGASFSRRFLPWEHLTDLTALVNAGLVGHGLPARRGIYDAVPLGTLDVHPRRVLDAIVYYRDHPGERSAIGSLTELARES